MRLQCGELNHACHLSAYFSDHCFLISQTPILKLGYRALTAQLPININATARNDSNVVFGCGFMQCLTREYKSFRLLIVCYSQMVNTYTIRHTGIWTWSSVWGKEACRRQNQHIPSVTIKTTCWSRKEFLLQGVAWPQTVDSLAA